ncbi:hypothetical protein L226DRAFT_567722 [Lentinus tigrinus ALCF2SS1-7]|uniref:Uncharacterized protein n=1 Tax=Lentinus tigrinus ALCF2SS1-6 TaxID=1328759 RepID=A0A5C2RQ21_9APHY|nr:hypothetical protein L227DRAFT_616792 [Lentinus tigrinus ALCF2SS1-6]RPD79645.1 hypothetical protein L226DRAFT_567722 [Lentinus tigrinus ALCF2SS1-7]
MSAPAPIHVDEEQHDNAQSPYDTLSFDRDYDSGSEGPSVVGIASSASLRHFKNALSPTGFEQLLRMQTVDFCRVDHRYLEEQFPIAIRELERVESFTGALFRALIEIKRTQKSHDDRVVRVEEEITQVRAEIEELMQPLKASYASARAELCKEKKGIETMKVHHADRMETIENSLHKVQLNATVLRSQCVTHRKDLDELSEQLLPTQQLAHSLATRLLDMEQREEGVWSILKELREDVFQLQQPDVTGTEHHVGDETEFKSLADEIAADTPHVASMFALPVVPTRASDGWYYNNDQCEEDSEPSMPSTDICGEISDDQNSHDKEVSDWTSDDFKEIENSDKASRGSEDGDARPGGEQASGWSAQRQDVTAASPAAESQVVGRYSLTASLSRRSQPAHSAIERVSSSIGHSDSASMDPPSDASGRGHARLPTGFNIGAFIRCNRHDWILRVGEGIYHGVLCLRRIHPWLPYILLVLTLGFIWVTVHLLRRWYLHVNVPLPSRRPSEHPVWEWALQRTQP